MSGSAHVAASGYAHFLQEKAGDALSQEIVAMEVSHLAIPVTSRRDHGIGTVEGTCEVVVLRLETEDGTTGWGEAAPWAPFTGSAEASFAAFDRYMRPLVLGRPVGARAAIMEESARAVAHCTEAKAALESALLDLTGRVLGAPVWALLGGLAQPRVPLSVSIANPDFDADRALIEQLVADGIGILKLKAGFAGPEFDILRLEHIRQQYPDLQLRVDYNQGLHPDEAERRIRDVATFAPDFIEQPVRADLFDLMARLRATVPVPLLADESVFGPEDMARAAREGIADGVSIKVMKSGGPTRALTVARMAGAAGLMAYGGDMFETGLGHLAGLHMIAATPEITLGCEFYQATYYLTEDILSEPFPVEHGEVVVPTGPGLGLSPDPDLIARYAIRREAHHA